MRASDLPAFSAILLARDSLTIPYVDNFPPIVAYHHADDATIVETYYSMRYSSHPIVHERVTCRPSFDRRAPFTISRFVRGIARVRYVVIMLRLSLLAVDVIRYLLQSEERR